MELSLTTQTIQLAQRLMSLFSPLQGYRGIYPKDLMPDPQRPEKMVAAGKFDGKFEMWDVNHWVEHIEGQERFGSAPLRHDGTIRFAAMDIDEYMVKDHVAVSKKLRKLSEKFILCRSKSGGKHLFLFFSEDVAAKNIRIKLTEVLSVLGLAGSEIFPVQDTLIAGIKNVGNYINTPYFNAKDTLQYAFHPDTSEVMTLEEFLDYGEANKFTEKEFLGMKFVDGSHFKNGPPCLQVIFENGCEEGGRNTTLQNVGVYCKLSSLSGWEDKVREYNTMLLPPMDRGEVEKIIHSLKHNEYHYGCNKEPLSSFCDRKKCKLRKYGVNNNSTFPFIESIVKFDSEPPIWWVNLDGGQRIYCQTEELQNPKRFQKCAMDQANMVTPVIKEVEWTKYLHELMTKLQVIPVAKEARTSGLLQAGIEDFLRTRASGETLQDLSVNQAVRMNGKYYFTPQVLIDFLRGKQFKVTDARLALLLNDMGAEGPVKKSVGKTSRRVYILNENIIDIEAEEIPAVPVQQLGVM